MMSRTPSQLSRAGAPSPTIRFEGITIHPDHNLPTPTTTPDIFSELSKDLDYFSIRRPDAHEPDWSRSTAKSSHSTPRSPLRSPLDGSFASPISSSSSSTLQSSPSMSDFEEEDPLYSPASSAGSTPTLSSPLRLACLDGLSPSLFPLPHLHQKSSRVSSPSSPTQKRSPRLDSHPYRSAAPMIRSYSVPIDTQRQLDRRLSHRGSLQDEAESILSAPMGRRQTMDAVHGAPAMSSAMGRRPSTGLGLSMGASPLHFPFQNPFQPTAPPTFPYNVSTQESPRRAALQRTSSSGSVPTIHVPFFPAIIGTATPPRQRRSTVGAMSPLSSM